MASQRKGYNALAIAILVFMLLVLPILLAVLSYFYLFHGADYQGMAQQMAFLMSLMVWTGTIVIELLMLRTMD